MYPDPLCPFVWDKLSDVERVHTHTHTRKEYTVCTFGIYLSGDPLTHRQVDGGS
jgi:hypothetical protein